MGREIHLELEDYIRKRQATLRVDADLRVEKVIEMLINQYRLPLYTPPPNSRPIEYELIQKHHYAPLDPKSTLAQEGIKNDDTIKLVSDRGRQAWLEIRDVVRRVRSRVAERGIESSWSWADRQLQTVEATGTSDLEVAELRQLVNQHRRHLRVNVGRLLLAILVVVLVAIVIYVAYTQLR